MPKQGHFTCMPAELLRENGRLETIKDLTHRQKRNDTINELMSSVPEQRKLPLWKEVKQFEKETKVVDLRVRELENQIERLRARYWILPTNWWDES